MNQLKESYEHVSPRVNSFKPGYKANGGNVEIFDEKKTIKAESKIDSFNKKYIRPGGDIEVEFLVKKRVFYCFLKDFR